MHDKDVTTRRAIALKRLLAPRHIAVFGGDEAEEVIRQCRRVGFAGDIWPVHPHRRQLDGYDCARSVSELPAAPDASFIAAPASATVNIVADLAQRGAGGAVCYASGFAEIGDSGAALQNRLTGAMGDMAVVGPNCYGLLNYLDGAALWPDLHGGQRLDRGVAIISQSGNMAMTMTMQRRSLPLAYMIAVGNMAGVTLAQYIDTLIEDPRITAIGLHLEGLADPVELSRAAINALRKNIPIVVLKTGASELGAQVTLSHTSSLAGPERLNNALFERVGIPCVRSIPEFLEALKFCALVGPLPSRRIASISCSGGEAALVADRALEFGLELPALTDSQRQRLYATLGDRVTLSNPLDYHTYIWGDGDAQRACFSAMLDGNQDITLKLLDFPPPGDDRRYEGWNTALDALAAASACTGRRAVLVMTLAETLPNDFLVRVVDLGIVPMFGINECLISIRAAADIGARQRAADGIEPLIGAGSIDFDKPALDEWQSKAMLRQAGIAVPPGMLVGADGVVEAAERLGFPVAVKAVTAELPHKTEAGAVRLDLHDAAAVREAADGMSELSDRYLIESMIELPVAEMFIGVTRDARYGFVLVIGAGGVMVELLDDVATFLLPVSESEIRMALQRLRIAKALAGYRSQPAGDIDATVDAVMRVVKFVMQNADGFLELDINPLFVMPNGQGVVAADALIRMQTTD